MNRDLTPIEGVEDFDSARELALNTSAATPKSAAPNWLARLFFGDVPLAVAESLRLEPCRWSVDDRLARYQGWIARINRDDGIEVWVGNRTYGMHVRGFGSKWGDVTTLSAVGLSPGHHLLRWAADRWLGGSGPHGRLLSALRGSGSTSVAPQVSQPIREDL